MLASPTELKGVFIIEPKVFDDERGFFFESYNHQKFKDATKLDVTFVQDNHSKSSLGVLRGLHFQNAPHAQGKLVRVLQGNIFDVAIDIRPHSVTFGQWVSAHLSSENKKQIWIPAGFAHGFLTLSETAEVAYKTTGHYHPESECSLNWDDPQIGIQWPENISPILSSKDLEGLPLSALQTELEQ